MNDRAAANNFWLFLELLARRRTFIVTFVLLATLAAVITAFALPKWYRATALLLPPKDVTLPTPGAGRLEDVVSVTKGLNLPVMVTPSDVYARMLKSRTIAREIVERFDLMALYKEDNFVETYDVLMDRARFRVTEEGLLEISVEDRNAARAAAIANAFVDVLDSINREIVTGRVRQNRTFVQERLAVAKVELDSARAQFREFQMRNRAIDFDEQTRLAIDQAARLKSDLASLDIDIAMKEQTLGADNTDLRELKRRRATVQDRLDQLERSNPDSSFFSLPVSAIPTLRGQYEVLYSRVRVAESIYRILLEQLEEVKYQEQEKQPVLSVLDRAVPPEIKSRPQRSIIVLAAFALAVLAAVLLAAAVDYVDRMRTASPENYRRVQMFAQAWFGWLPGLKRRPAE
ncbi:MAG TPA: Wzz/FepE/Etk N-terminal domain-containing protein [candidate division Zixibacteria bacterium]|nr:hypothetical protein [candidate division Zixibacteria bacterium]MDD4916408.1 Wzz/FepE/Etk N-terminal domain-containing protein [candidate division Zixibacteria bacterium]MDM7972547.1 Wzz/FepE/Etk N-terminal domain-containing protein [candidate division Zixibacteria bacterium]HOD65667.1 Wzz/FepE/Etk N-terminal domain-containing protein [candidate division Zixibacteria bacterium]HPM37713.1 Wzz/FepE/Etk N-terminal domain-containing protein [candidate division Zixibacteria bacterium]